MAALASRSDAPFLLDYAPIYAVKSVHYAADYALNLQICSDYALPNFDERKKTAIFPGVEILDHCWFCNLKCAIARENALLQLKPFRVVGECREFE